MNDFCITTDAVYLKEDIDILLQEIDTLFDTNLGQIFGIPLHATDFERFLWNLNISTDTISQYIKSTIYSMCDTFNFNIDVETSAHYGTNTDIILVQINIKCPDGYSVERIYKIG